MLSPSLTATRILRRLGTVASSSSIRSSLGARWASTLVVSEPLVDGGATPPGTQSAVTAAAQLGQPIELLVVGEVAPSHIPAGVSKVYHVAIADKLSESVALAIQAATKASGETSVVMGTSSKFGSTVIPRAAALLNVSPVTDILEIIDESKSDNWLEHMHVVSMYVCMYVCSSQSWKLSSQCLFAHSTFSQKHSFVPCTLAMSCVRWFPKTLL